jgi:hypothetical protein
MRTSQRAMLCSLLTESILKRATNAEAVQPWANAVHAYLRAPGAASPPPARIAAARPSASAAASLDAAGDRRARVHTACYGGTPTCRATYDPARAIDRIGSARPMLRQTRPRTGVWQALLAARRAHHLCETDVRRLKAALGLVRAGSSLRNPTAPHDILHTLRTNPLTARTRRCGPRQTVRYCGRWLPTVHVAILQSCMR